MRLKFLLLLLIYFLSAHLLNAQLYKAANSPTYSTGSHSPHTSYKNEVIFRSAPGEISVLKKDQNGDYSFYYKLPDPSGKKGAFGWGPGYKVVNHELVIPISGDESAIALYKRDGEKWVVKTLISNHGGAHYTYSDYNGQLAVFGYNRGIVTHELNKLNEWQVSDTLRVTNNIMSLTLHQNHLIVGEYYGIRKARVLVFKRIQKKWIASDTLYDPDSSRYYCQRLHGGTNQLFVTAYWHHTQDGYWVSPNTKVYAFNQKGKLELKQSIFHPTDSLYNFFGEGLDCDGKTLVIGSPGTVTPKNGELMVYHKDHDNKWQLTKTLSTYKSRAGSTVSVSENIISGGSNVAQGAIYDVCGQMAMNKNHLCRMFPSEYDLKNDPNYNESTSIYTQKLTNQLGCDSMIKTLIDTKHPKLKYYHKNGVYVADTGFTNYRWVNCNNGSVIQSKSPRYFGPNSTDDYKVIADFGNCSVESDCNATASVSPINSLELSVWPNPAQNQVHFQSNHRMTNIAIYNLHSKVVIQQSLNHLTGSINTEFLQNGMYLARIRLANEQEIQRRIIVTR